MSDPSTWIKLDRNITKWGWYQDANTSRVFIHLLLKANIEDKMFMGVPVKRGEYIATYPKLARDLNLTEKQVRTAIKHLKGTGEVAVKTYSKFSLVSIENYDKYQNVPEIADKNKQLKKQVGRQKGSQGAVNGQAEGRQRASTKEYKNIRKKENIGLLPDLPSAATDYDPKDWEADEVPKSLWGRFDSLEEWRDWRDK